MSIQQLMDQAVEAFNAENLVVAAECCRQTLALDQRQALALRILGVCERREGRLEESRRYLQQAVDLMPQSGLLYFELGNTLVGMARHAEGYAALLKCVELKPKFAPAYINLCALMEQQERFPESYEWAKKAIACDPQDPLAHYNAANTLREMTRMEEALVEYEKSLQCKPDFPRAKWNLGLCHLLLGNYAEGWRLFEIREPAEEVFIDRYSEPRWDGSSLADKTIVVHAEQGIGDEIIFASCFDDVIARAKRTILVCEPRLEKLFRRSFPKATVYPWARRKDWTAPTLPEPFDVQVPAGSLPFHFRNSVESFPRREKFLIAHPELQAQWRARFAELGPGLRIGISWRAGGKPIERRKRSMPLIEWRDILSIPGVQWINLQYSDAESDIKSVYEQLGVRIHDSWDAGDPLLDMDDYAAKISALDLVISVGNATVHTAGALGIPAWTMLPLIPSWRWMAHGDYSPWYTSVRLFRQKARGDWTPVYDEIAGLLREQVGAPPETRRTVAMAKPATNTTEDNDDWLTMKDICAKASQKELPVWVEEGMTALLRNDFVAAEAQFRQILQLVPRHTRALLGLGLVAKATGRLELAIRSFRRSMSAYEALPENHCELGLALMEAGRLDEAETSLRRALELNSGLIAAHTALGMIYREDQRHREAEACLRAAIKLEPHNAQPRVQLARLFVDMGRDDDALQALHLALGENPEEVDALFDLALLYQRLSQPQSALRAFDRVIAARPQKAEAWHAAGVVLSEMGDHAEALSRYQRALHLRPENGNTRFAVATTLLQLGHLREGWEAYESRWKAPGARPRNCLPQAVWQGELLAEGTLLVHGEQGIGDEVMFASCYGDALARVKRGLILAEPRLTKLFARSFPEATIFSVTRGREHAWKAPANVSIDRQIAAGSLPGLFRNAIADFPRRERYLVPDANKVERSRIRFAELGPGLKVGVAWRGGDKAADRRLRWIDLQTWLPVLAQEHCHFISVQHGLVENDLNSLNGQAATIRQLPEIKPGGDLDDFAADLSALDLLISVGNANVHLAGALGVTTWCLLPLSDGWRWLVDREDSVWYSSVRLFRQNRRGGWRELMERVAAELSKFNGHATDDASKQTATGSPLHGPHWRAAAAVRQAAKSEPRT